MKNLKNNIYTGINIEKMLEYLKADLFLGEVALGDFIGALFYSKTPALDHKQFIFVVVIGKNKISIAGYNEDEVWKKFKKIQTVGKCIECGEVIRSVYRHDYVSCKCGKAFIDGGQEDYVRYSNCELLEWDLFEEVVLK